VTARGRRAFLGTAGAILALALALRVHRLGVEEFWLDEAFSFRDVTVPGWLRDLRLKDVPPLYPLLLRGWMALAGQGEAALRLLSALLGTLAVAATMWAGLELFDPGVALWSGLWAAVSPMAVYYSQEARPYALLTALAATACAAVWRAARGNRARDWALAAVVLAALLYTHYLAVLALVPTALVLAAWPRADRARPYAAAVAVAGLVFLPWLVWSFVLTAHPMTGVDWVAEAWQRTPLTVPASLEVLVLGSEKGRLPITLKQFDVLEFPRALRVLALATLALAAVWVAGPWSGRDAEGRSLARRKAMLAGSALLPLAVLWAVSWWKPLYLAGRYDALAFPGVVLLLGLAFATLGCARPAGPLLAAVAALGLLVPIGTKLVLYHRQPVASREPNRRTAVRVLELVHEGDLVIFTDLRGYGVAYQLAVRGWRWEEGACAHAATGRRFACRTFPRPLGPLPTERDVARVANAPDTIRADLREDLAAAGEPGRVLLAFGTWGTEGGGFAVPRDDGLLLQELARLGFGPASVDPRLGIVEYRRGVPAARRVPAS
jgi:hypothetical protein